MTRFHAFRLSAAVGSLLVALTSSLFFYGTGDNLVMLVITVAFLLLSVSLAGAHGIRTAVSADPVATVFAGLALAVLVLEYQWSLSQDSSFAPTWVLAALPLTFLVALGFDAAHRRWLFRGVLTVGGVFACISIARLVLFGERAHLPLVDPNNYATLLYLLWIPFVAQGLTRGWRGTTIDGRSVAAGLSLSFVILAALFATHSRAAAVVIVVALTIWLVVALVRRWSPWGVLRQVFVAGAAFSAVLLASPPDLLANRVASLGMGVAVRADLIESGWRMFLDHPIRGVGAFCFSLMYGGYRLLSEQITAGLFVHNDYVQLLAEGGILLVSLPLVLAYASVGRSLRGFVADVQDERFAKLGVALALGAACAHAAINFVFYSLPVVIVMGILAAGLMTREAATDDAKVPSALKWSVVGAVAFGWLAFGYLLVDLATVAVFQGQPGVPFVNSIRQDEEAQMRFARIADALNDDRGIPVLAQAMLLARDVDRQTGLVSPDPAPDVSAEKTRALREFRRAIVVDPWNTLAYVALADYLRRYGSGLELCEGESPDELLLTALGLDPVHVPAIDRLLEIHAERRRFGDSYALLKTVVFPWLELLKRTDERAAERYMAEMSRLAQLADDTEFVAAVAARRSALATVSPARHRQWFRASQPAPSGA